MGSLALGTYWLVRTTPPVQEAAGPSAVPQGPDYTLQGFVMRTFDAHGTLRSEVAGDTATHFPDKKTIAIDNIRIQNVDSVGRVSTASARQGVTDDAQTQVELLGQARVVREAFMDAKGQAQERAEYRSEYLLAHLKDEVVSSNQPVQLLRGGGDTFTADTLHYDNGSRILELRGRVRGILVPRTASALNKAEKP